MGNRIKNGTRHIYKHYRLHIYLTVGIGAVILAVWFAWRGFDAGFDRASRIAELDLAPILEAWVSKAMEIEKEVSKEL